MRKVFVWLLLFCGIISLPAYAWFDNWADNDYTANPRWQVCGAGTWVASLKNLRTTSVDTAIYENESIVFNGTWHMAIKVNGTTSYGHMPNVYMYGYDACATGRYPSNSYSISDYGAPKGFGLFKHQTGTDWIDFLNNASISVPAFTTGDVFDYYVSRSNGNFTVNTSLNGVVFYKAKGYDATWTANWDDPSKFGWALSTYFHDWQVINASQTPFSTTVAATAILNATFKNTTGARKKVFKEGEEIVGYANFTLSNNTVLAAATCNQTYINASFESDSFRQNFTICNSGCNYVRYNNKTNYSKVNFLRDVLHFSACRISPPTTGSLAITLCGKAIPSVPISTLPLCSSAPAFYFLNSTVCSAKGYINFSIVGGVPSVRVTNLQTDRFFTTLKMGMKYNSTLKKYVASREVEYYKHGAKVVLTNCTESTYNKAVTNTITIVNAPPQMSLQYVTNNLQTVNLSGYPVIQFADGRWDFYSSVVDDDLGIVRYQLRNRTALLRTNTSSIAISPFSYNSSNFVALRRGNPYNFSVWANDSFKNITYRSIKFNISDTAAPVCSPLSGQAVQNSSYIVWNVTCTDEYFFSLNMSCSNGASYYKQDIGATVFKFYNYSKVNTCNALGCTDIRCNWTYCDGHTAQAINDMAVAYAVNDVARTDLLDKGSGGSGRALDIKPLQSEESFISFGNSKSIVDTKVSQWAVRKSSDRYTFCMAMTGPVRSLKFSIPEGFYAAPGSPYSGHLVNPVKREWWDFVADQGGVATVHDTYVAVDYPVDVKTACFSSVGKFNCVNVLQQFNVTLPLRNSSSRQQVNYCPDTTAGAMIAMLIVGIAMFFILIGFLRQVGLAGFMGAVILLVESWTLVDCNHTVGFVLALCSLLLMAVFAVMGFVGWKAYG